MDFSNYLFHCHDLYKIMTDPQTKEAKQAGELSTTAKTELAEIYTEAKYNRTKDVTTKQIEKGLHKEEAAITLYSKYRKEFFFKNEERLTNAWLTGMPDIRVEVPDPAGIKSFNDRFTFDTKCSWDLHSHNKHLTEEKPPSSYWWQGQAYMWLDNADRHTVAYCLVNTPDFIVEREVKALQWKVPASQLFEAEQELRRSMKFDDVPLKERVIEFTFRRDDIAIERIKGRVEKAREYLNYLHKKSKL